MLAPKAVAQLVVLPAAEGLAASLLRQTRRKRLRAARLEVGAPHLPTRDCVVDWNQTEAEVALADSESDSGGARNFR